MKGVLEGMAHLVELRPFSKSNRESGMVTDGAQGQGYRTGIHLIKVLVQATASQASENVTNVAIAVEERPFRAA